MRGAGRRRAGSGVNITALTGRWAASGEVFLLRIGRDGAVAVIEEIPTDP